MKKECPFKHERIGFESVEPNGTFQCALMRYVFECVGEDKCPILRGKND